ncbi:MAG: hypothetical protein AOA65_1501 [Candidatus Bathyarchaeota archaeon BA1]|nr:MAG: hypothetical protein AOA65_1501 [Candidatus Bathyarchaeota archaeon BA1]
MPKRPSGLLSFGVLAVIVAICLIAYMPLQLITVNAIIPLILAFFGVWVLILAGIKSKGVEKYERGAFSTFGWGILLIAIGGAWSLAGVNWIYSLILLLLTIGVLAVAAALRLSRKK